MRAIAISESRRCLIVEMILKAFSEPQSSPKLEALHQLSATTNKSFLELYNYEKTLENEFPLLM